MIDTETIVKLWEAQVELETIVKVAGFKVTEEALRGVVGKPAAAPAVTKTPRVAGYTRTVARGDVLRLLSTGGASIQDLMKTLNLERKTIHSVLERAEELKLVQLNGSLWRLTERGREYTIALKGGQMLSKQAFELFESKFKGGGHVTQ